MKINAIETEFTNSEISLGVTGLSNFNSSMVEGGLYTLIAELPSARFPMLSGSLFDAIQNGVPCTIILPSDAPAYLQRIEASSGLDSTELINNKSLHVFTTKAEFSKNIFRLSAEGFVLELEQYGIPENSLLIFEQADDLLALHDITLALQQVSILKQWFSKKNITSLLIFSRATQEHVSTINSLMDYLAGVARLGGNGDGLELTFNYWQTQQGVIAAKSYSLMTLDSGLYEATARKSYEFKAPVDFSYAETSYQIPSSFESVSTNSNDSQNLRTHSVKYVQRIESDAQPAVQNSKLEPAISMFDENTQQLHHLNATNMSSEAHLATFGKKSVPRATRSSWNRSTENSSKTSTLH
jgi:hypothetical protein